jgi:hypothetical protein
MRATVQRQMILSISYQPSKMFRISTDWTVRGSSRSNNEFPAPVQTGPGAHQSSLYIGYQDVIPGCGVNPTPS